MHIQPHFAETRVPVLHELMRSRPLATFIVAAGDDIVVNHMPLMIENGDSEYGVIRGHTPRSNSIWQTFDGERTAVAVFQGPDTYVSPSWYPSKREHGKAVPTWNYVVAHAHGCPVAMHDEAWLLEHLQALTNMQEAAQAQPWRVSDAPPDYVEKMLRGIVGIEMPITRLEGKWKVSQNRPEEDRLAVAAELRERGDTNSLAMAALIQGSKI
jgi:transcriptional regulator